MIDEHLVAGWDEAPRAMSFEEPFREVLDGVLGRAALLSRPGDGLDPARVEAALGLYLRAPALVNLTLNHKICVEHGLPLHPTVYYELVEARRYRIRRNPSELEEANALYRSAIDLARAALRLEPDLAARAGRFSDLVPPELWRFVYSGGGDKYTWMGAEPALLRRLASAVLRDGRPAILVGAAHGAIMPALLLAEYLGCPLYFIRLSMFKRRDEEPVVSLADEAWLSAWRAGPALLFDEDVAGGTTLARFSARLGPLFAAWKSAAVLRHGSAAFRPDYVARSWWD
ncbi:MAG TPA: phosphoribosyltransferase [Spirochaetales bacterium]|nr:phosphoribosyltransferase [Spirochaetales bacterium]